MKYATLALLGMGLAIGLAPAQGQTPPAAKGETELKTVEQKFAYAIGLDLGRRMKQSGVPFEPDNVAKGLRDGLAGTAAFTDKQLEEIQVAFNKIMMEKRAAAENAGAAGPEAEKTLKDGQAFLAKNKSLPGVTTLPSGVQYKVLKSGTGKTPKLADTVLANYRGTLIDGTEFDSSAKGGKPIEFGVGEVIPGWTEVLQLMKEGDKWQVVIPADKAYGARQRGPLIAPNSTLIFDMELVKVL